MSDLRATFARFVDDTAMLAPGAPPLGRAVREHRAHRDSEYAPLIGAFVLTDARIPDLLEMLGTDPARDGDPLGVRVRVSGGAGAIEGAVRWASRAPALDLAAIEFALRDEADPAHNARRLLAMLDNVAEDLGDAEVVVEPPRFHGAPSTRWLDALDALATRELQLTFRVGGPDPDDAPTTAELAACIGAALDRELPFRCTAGLDGAIRRDGRHGFLNVLAATVIALEGADVTATLAETSAEALADVVHAEGERGRRWFRSFGSIDVQKPYEQLVDLGLL